MRVVVVGGGVGGGAVWFEKIIDFRFPAILSTKVFFGVGSVEINQDMLLLDQIFLWGGIRHSLTRFLFGVGSVTPQTDFSSGWDLSHLYTVHTMAFVRVKSLNIYVEYF